MEHLLVIPDGNRRYAVEHGLAYADSYRLAVRKLVDLMRWWLDDRRVPMLSIGWLTTHNFINRPADQVQELGVLALDLMRGALASGAEFCATGNAKAFVQSTGVPEDALSTLLAHSNSTHECSARTVNILYAYDPEADFEAASARVKENAPFTFKAAAQHGCMPPVTISLRAGYPMGFNKVSCYSPGIERARLFSTPKRIQEFCQSDFVQIMDTYFYMIDSVDKLLIDGHDSC